MTSTRFSIFIAIIISSALFHLAISNSKYIDDVHWERHKEKFRRKYRLCTDEVSRYILYLTSTRQYKDNRTMIVKGNKFSDMTNEEMHKRSVGKRKVLGKHSKKKTKQRGGGLIKFYDWDMECVSFSEQTGKRLHEIWNKWPRELRKLLNRPIITLTECEDCCWYSRENNIYYIQRALENNAVKHKIMKWHIDELSMFDNDRDPFMGLIGPRKLLLVPLLHLLSINRRIHCCSGARWIYSGSHDNKSSYTI